MKRLVTLIVLLAFVKLGTAQKNGLSILPVVDANTVEVGKLLYQNEAFKQNSGLQDCLGNLVLKEAVAHPNNIINMLLTNQPIHSMLHTFKNSTIPHILFYMTIPYMTIP